MAAKSVSDGEDKEVGELGFLARDRTEGSGLAKVSAEVGPDSEDLVAGFLALGSGGFGGDLERKAEISCELLALGRCSSCQGLSCG